MAPAGRRGRSLSGCARPITAPTASATSTAATASAMTSSGACSASTRRRSHAGRLKSIRAARPNGYRLFVILGNLSANKTPAIPPLAKPRKRRLALPAPHRPLAQPDRAAIRADPHLHHERLGPPQPHRAGPPPAELPALAQRPRPPPDVLAAQRRERARI